jgi:hypothetical protein
LCWRKTWYKAVNSFADKDDTVIIRSTLELNTWMGRYCHAEQLVPDPLQSEGGKGETGRHTSFPLYSHQKRRALSEWNFFALELQLRIAAVAELRVRLCIAEERHILIC